jgi:uncharacterized protein YjiS (DUF1127 family)
MDPRNIQEQTGLFPGADIRTAEQIEAIRAQAVAARDAAVALMLQRSAATIWSALGAVATAIVTWPERRAAYSRLRALGDRELADIGLTRGDIPRIFDPDFRFAGTAANANQPAGARADAA